MSAASYVAHLHVVTLLICGSGGKLSRWTEQAMETYCLVSLLEGYKTLQ
jgi:hypothetical protein